VVFRLRAAFRKEFVQFFRSTVLVVLVLYAFAEPVLCGLALTMDVRNLPLLVVDQDRSSASRSLAERFRIAPYFAYTYADGGVDPDQALEKGDAALVLVIPRGLAAALGRGEPASVELLADGTYSNFAALALADATQIVSNYNVSVRTNAAVRGGGSGGLGMIVNRVRMWYMPGLEYTHEQMLAMLGISALLLGVLLPAAAIVREKEAGTLEQLMVTPLRPVELVIAKLVPMGLLMMVGLVIGVAEARLVFGTHMRGNLSLFFGLSVLMLFTSMGLGAYIGAVARNLLQTLLLTFFVLFTLGFLSGTIVPVANMPLILQWLSYLSPIRYYLPIATEILSKGLGFEYVAPNAIALGVYGLVLMTIGARQLRRTFAG
jgi:ABC-2 type transport system permease protein